MNRNDLYNSFNKIDDDILERSENTGKSAVQDAGQDVTQDAALDKKAARSTEPDTVQGKKAHSQKKSTWVKWIAMAACLCLTVIALLRFLPATLRESPVTPSTDMEEISEGSFPSPTDAGEFPGDSSGLPVVPYGHTSDTYASLPELLAYLSSHDNHSDARTDASESTVSLSKGESNQPEYPDLTESTGVVVNFSGEYAYHIGESSVFISRLDKEDTENVGSIDISADSIFLCNNNLLIISSYQSGGDELNQEMSVRVSIYDITAPQAPALLDEYTQLGELTACWMSGANLYLVTSDGVCACGWSRLEDSSGYYPALSRNSQAMEWGDDLISILGEPTRVQYSAITVINGNSRDVVARKALYGNNQNLFYGADWIAAVAAGETATFRENPTVFTFDSRLSFTGKISAAQIINAPETNVLEDYIPQDGGYLHLASVTKQDGIYRMLGTYDVREGEHVASYFLALTADTETGSSGSGLLAAEDYPYGSFTEIVWEKNRAISCIGIMSHDMAEDLRQETRFLFTEFDGLDISFHENKLTADYLNGRVGVTYGNPFGEFKTLIPMGNGIYVRYAALAEGPEDFDLFDFSDSSAPLCLYSSEASLSGNDAFDYAWYVYDENTFGTLKVLLGDETFFRDVKLSWCVYTIDTRGKTTITLQKEIFLTEEVRTYIGADSLGFAVFRAGDDMYYVTGNQPSAALLR